MLAEAGLYRYSDDPAERKAEIPIDEHNHAISAQRYDASPWTDEERDLLRAESLDALGWEGMEAYQDDQP